MPELTPVYGLNAPVAGAPYSPAIRAGNLLFISGQLGLDPETKQPHADFAKQVEICLAGLTSLVEAAGGTLDNVAKTTIFLDDLANFAQVNEIYARHFSGAVKPARSTFQVAKLPLGAAVEIEAIAYLGE